MLKCASVYTHEIDDPEKAFEEIRIQLDSKVTLLEHTVGIVMCHPEFISSGVFKYISEKFPFDLAGATTSSQAVNGEAGELILTIFVMTADDIWFKTGITGEFEGCIDAPVKTALENAMAGTSESPKLALIFPPKLQLSGDTYINACQKIIPNVPIFGTLAVDDSIGYNESKTVHNGESFKAAMSFILCYGNINPRFIVGTLPLDKIMPYKGEITKSNGSYVYEINNINAYEYFEGIGLAKNGVLSESYLFLPFMIDSKKRADYDGIPILRVLASFTKDGAAFFRGDIDEGSTFTMLTCGADEVVSTTSQKARDINNLAGVNGVLLFSCIVRRMMTMRTNPLMELEAVRDIIDPGIPFMMGYAGGEISPTSVKNGVPANRFHNYSLVILVV